ncbi:4fe-4s ferredoxin, iron-sulfur binding [hydrocarbon metagenome]|uniref:4fe-4s ferredoxin, iron-sulfur binding n=1 Tax=hydrocarbon metagenome TaxID=938273 RepID=A0A0W8FXF5_9ZZZZ
MAVMITDECIACNACEPECPNNAIYDAGIAYDYAGEEHAALNDDHTYIVPEKCTECVGFYDEPQCIEACPTEAIIMDPERVESKEELMKKKEYLDQVGR